jgi:hypothetical protein
LFVAALVGLIWMSDSRMEAIVAQLEPGVADADVQRLLEPVRYYKAKITPANEAYVFYGIDGFVYVVMEKTGDEMRVARVDHNPDTGPLWDRLRRSWERRMK